MRTQIQQRDVAYTVFVRCRRKLQPIPLAEPSGRKGLQERVATSIVEAAARVIAVNGDQASMSDVAAEAGIARATLYRYFSTRAQLLDALTTLAARQAAEALATSRLDQLQTREGVVRAIRALLEVGDPLVAISRERVPPNSDHFADVGEEPLRRLIERGQASGELRGDIPPEWLTQLLFALVVRALAVRPVLGREDAVAAISSLYLDGAHTRPSALATAG